MISNNNGTANAISAAVAVMLIIASAAVGFAVGQRTTCFDFFGLAKTCTIVK